MNRKKTKKGKTVEIAASWGFKFSAQNSLTLKERTILENKLQGVSWQTQDFFQSCKATCAEKDRDAKAEDLHEFCKRIVMKQVNAYAAELHEAARETEIKKSGIDQSLPGPYMKGGRNYVEG